MDHADLISLDMIRQFLKFDTTSDRSNLHLINHVKSFLEGLGFKTWTFFNADQAKANLLASSGPLDRPGIILSGHTDTVPVDGQHWSVDPFDLTVKHNRLYGRGICDMKGFLAIALAFAPMIAKSDLTRPIHFVLSYDEEIGCLGVHSLIQHFEEMVVPPLGCIVGEPSGMDVVTAHKGTVGFEITVGGLEAHTGVAHLGANAVSAAAEIIHYINQIQNRLKLFGPFNSDFAAPNYTVLEPTVIHGGTAINIVPAYCRVEIDVRYLPGESPADYIRECQRYTNANILPMLQSSAPSARILWQELPGCAAFQADRGSDIVSIAQTCTQKSECQSVGWGTEAGYFQNAGIPTVVCGPGSIEQAHKPDEFITIEQVHKCEQFMHRLIKSISI